MADVFAIGFICILAVGVDWLFRSSRLRVFMYLVFMAAAITSCTKLGEHENLLFDGLVWTVFFTMAGTRLLFKRSRYFERDRG
ncbi:hypothetical protein [Pseudomonas sp. NY15374]|uniref:hypothetical protein n=1 Tax=Pseudomonas sp. NY15374 TaxID=3400357 RepID=UPI003A8B6048